MEQRFLDIIWLDNLLVNFIVLWLTRKLAGNSCPMWRLWCSAGLGASYAIALILPGFGCLNMLPFKFLLSLIMLAAGFRIRTLREFFKLFGYFYGITFLLGGAAFGLFYLFGRGIQVSGGVFLIKDFPAKILISAIVSTIMLYRWLWPWLQFRINRNQLVYRVKIQFDNNCIVLDAFLDTGNELTDPISGVPVMVAEFDKIRSVLPPDIQKIYLRGREGELKDIIQTMEQSDWIRRFCIVPYRTLGHSNGLLLAFRPDSVHILTNGGWKEAADTLIGIRKQDLSASGEYHALIQPHIIP